MTDVTTILERQQTYSQNSKQNHRKFFGTRFTEIYVLRDKILGESRLVTAE